MPIWTGCVLASLWASGCATGPAPIVIYESQQESVWLHFDPKAGAGHNHPVSLTPEQIVTVLKGVRVKNRDVIGGFDLLSDKDRTPAFSTREILTLSPYLSQALQKASPKDIATFRVTTRDPTKGLLVTSGGLFVRNGHLYFILANNRTSPSSVQYENTYEPDPRGDPLLPIARFKFSVSFTPDDVRLPSKATREQDRYPDYLDDSKLIVLDLARLFGQAHSPAATLRP